VDITNNSHTQTKPSLRGDIVGGITASVLAMAESMAYGALALAPLGIEYAALGSAAGLIALAFSNLGASIFSGVRIMINGPYAMTSLMLSSALAIIVKEITQDATTALVFLFLTVFLTGLLQIFFGFLKLGNLAKYIPYPVVAGLSNGTAILILFNQIKPLLGVDGSSHHGGFITLLRSIQPMTLIVGLITIISVWQGKKFLRGFPPSLAGILIGTASFYVISLVATDQPLGSVIGAIPFTVPTPKYAFQFLKLSATGELFAHLITIAPLAGGIAIILSLKTMLNSVSADNITQTRSNNNHELIGQGLGNMLAALFGGIASVGTRTNTNANYSAGGRNARSKLFSGIFTLIAILLLGPLLRFVPKVVLAGILVMVAMSAFDPWGIQTLKRIVSTNGHPRDLQEDLAIIILVMAITITVGVFEAAGVGLIIALAVFVFRMSKDTIRREFDVCRVRSHVSRPDEESQILAQHGRLIKAFELEGVLFFGSADRLASRLDPLIDGDTEFFVLDFKRISHVDSTGGNILAQLQKKCHQVGKFLLISGIKERRSILKSLSTNGVVLHNLSGASVFPEIEDALAWAEDQLLDEFLDPKRRDKAIPLKNIKVFSQLNAEELDILFYHISSTEYDDKCILFRQGDSGNEIFFIQKGRVDIFLDFENEHKRKRIVALSAGTVMGEIEVLDKKSRSATAVANGRLTCMVLSMESIQTLAREHPDMTHKILLGLGRELAGKVRNMNALVTNLKT